MWRAFWRAETVRFERFILLAACLFAGGCGPGADESAVDPALNELSAEERSAEPLEGASDRAAYGIPVMPVAKPPIDIRKADTVKLRLVAETAYLDERQRYVVDLMERDMAYLTIVVETADGSPVRGAVPRFDITGTSRVVAMSERVATDDSGWIDIGVVGGTMGSDRLEVSVGERKMEVQLNIISLKAMGLPALEEIKGGLSWEALMQAKFRFEGDRVAADFPAEIAARNGKTVKLIGYMLPLEAEEKQTHFLLTSNPPSCFFHIPGGPAGAVEVFADTGIKASWDPVVLEGRFETVQGGELGVLYRLRQARVASKGVAR